MSTYPQKVRIVEVGPRDGLQNEATHLSVKTRAEFIDMLAEAGHQSIEVGAFVRKVPQMDGTADVFAAINKKPGVSYLALVPNMKGMEAAVKAGLKEVAVFAAASESFSQKNIDCSIAESLARFKPVMEEALKHGIKVRGYVSCVFNCPYEGEIRPDAVVRVSKALHDMGCYEISLGDTIGTGTPPRTRELLQEVKKVIPVSSLAVHFHDTYSRALANISAALDEGIAVIDSSSDGLGGCPYAKGASGNVATEDVLDMLHQMRIETGVDIDKAAAAGQFISAALQRPVSSKVGQVLAARRNGP